MVLDGTGGVDAIEDDDDDDGSHRERELVMPANPQSGGCMKR